MGMMSSPSAALLQSHAHVPESDVGTGKEHIPENTQ